MLRPEFRSGLGVAVLLVLAASPVLAQQSTPPGRDWSVELQIEGEQTPAEKAASLNQKIMAMQAKGETGPALGDLYNDLGVIHAQQEQWDQARDAFIRAVQAKPYDPDFHRNLGLVFLRLEDYDLAISELQAYRDAGGPAALDSYRLIGQAYEKMNLPDEARQSYTKGLETLGREPSAETVRLALALAGVERAAGNDEAVRGLLENWQPVAREWRERAEAEGSVDGVAEAEAIENNLLSIYLEDGQILEDSGLAAEAVALYEKAFALAPDRDELLPRIVGAHLAAGNTFDAKVAARLARQDHPEQAGAWVASGKVQEADGNFDEALASYEKAYELDPTTPGLGMKIGTLYIQQGQGAKGREYLAEIIEAPATPTSVVYNYAVSLMRDDKFAAAVPPLKRVTREQPDNPQGWYALAQCYNARKMYAQAIPAYEKTLELNPDPSVAYNLGVVAGRAEQWDTCIAAYDQALALAPDNLDAARNRAIALMQAGRHDEADRAFASYLDRDPTNYKANLNRGVNLFKAGRYEEAVDAYNLTLEVQETAEAWDNLGLAYQELGDKKQAQQCFQEAKKLRGET
jgi:tetratricopeptide (TPR) repeat protein